MNYQKISNLNYAKMAISHKYSSTEKAGRYKNHKGIENYIFKDIKSKLSLIRNEDVLDIGCGCGPLTDKLIKFAIKKNIKLALCDIPEVIDLLRLKYYKNKNLTFINTEFQKTKFVRKYNKILCYSVLQCVSNPKFFFKKIFTLLKPNGKILIGDIPNINKKYRFLKSDFGNTFECERLKIKIRKPKNFYYFFKKTKQNRKLNDKLILFMINYSRKKNKDCYVLEQPTSLPFSFTREDILIV